MSVLVYASSLVTCLGVTADRKAPAEIVFIPEGENMITPQSHPDGITVNLPAERGVEIAARFQLQLEKRLGENVKPWIDFEHTRKHPAAGYPTAFRYQAGKGIMAAMEWSGSGSKAITNKDVGYFSPEFYLDAHGVPEGLPERGPIGGLVAEPAFRQGMAIAAAANHSHQNQTTTTAMKLLLAALNISPDAADAEASAVTAVNNLKLTVSRIPTLETEITELKGKVTASEADLKSERTSQGENLFSRAKKAGLVKEEDEDKEKPEYVEACESGNKLAVKLLTERIVAAEAGANKAEPSHLSRPLVAASQKAANQPQGDHAFLTEARKMVTAGRAKTESEGFTIVASERPELYQDYTTRFEGVN